MEMTFGFSYVGFVYLLMLYIPNIIWTKLKPVDYEKYEKQENIVLLFFERIGEALVTCASVMFSDFNIHGWSLWNIWLIVSFAFMVLYEIWWIRYFNSRRTMKDFYSSILGIPVGGASLPVLGFFLLSIYGKNPVLLISVVILGIGHIGIHLIHKKEADGFAG